LLLERVKEPNKGYLSPPGGKLNLQDVESPVACAVREAYEECKIKSFARDWKLLGIITEKSYPNIGDIMIFCFEYKYILETVPEDSNEGRFFFISPENIKNSKIPDTDKLYIWKFVLSDSLSIFSVHIDCSREPYVCTIEQE